MVAEAMGASVAALVAVITTLNGQIARLEEQLDGAEFGNEPDRYDRSGKNCAGTTPATAASLTPATFGRSPPSPPDV